MPRDHSFPETAQVARRVAAHRRKLLVLSCFLLLAAPTTVAFPYLSTMMIGAAAGWLLWLAGAAMIGAALLLGTRRSLVPALLAGLTAIGAGAYMLLDPTVGAIVTALLMGAVLIVEGAFELALALDLRPLRARRWVFASSIASLLSGAVILLGAGNDRIALAWLLGFALATSGLALLSVALATKAAAYGGDRGAPSAAAWRGRSRRMSST